jgi:hypothetical protein
MKYVLRSKFEEFILKNFFLRIENSLMLRHFLPSTKPSAEPALSRPQSHFYFKIWLNDIFRSLTLVIKSSLKVLRIKCWYAILIFPVLSKGVANHICLYAINL